VTLCKEVAGNQAAYGSLLQGAIEVLGGAADYLHGRVDL